MGAVVIMICFLIVTVVKARSTCGWWTGPAANCPIISLVAFGACSAIGRASALWFVGEVTFCAYLLGAVIVIVMVLLSGLSGSCICHGNYSGHIGLFWICIGQHLGSFDLLTRIL